VAPAILPVVAARLPRHNASMRSDSFNFTIPEHLIAQTPAGKRDESRLLVVRRGARSITHHTFRDLPGILNPGDLLVMNNTRVKPCRLYGTRSTGGRVEVFLIRKQETGRPALFEAITNAGGHLKEGETLTLEDATVTLIEKDAFGPGHWRIRLDTTTDIDAYLQSHGRMPLPPYIRRERDVDAHAPMDRERYQTIFAQAEGAVAAPTAGLHFTPEVFAALDTRGVGRAHITLHVGPGTFRPLKAATLAEHPMHSEDYTVPLEASAATRLARENGGRIVVVGTTTCRTLETVSDERGIPVAGSGATELFIYPPYRFRCTDALLTNFHLPNSTLIFLVAAWLGVDLTRQVYTEAIAQEYRFFSYGDAMLCLP
jgi:S-adenosylmethionine:tRNA ribosyltransferase-isomerase